MSRSLKTTWMLYNAMAVAGLLVVAGLVIYFLVREALYTEFNRNLRETCQSFAQLVEVDGERVESEMAEKELPCFSRRINPDVYQIFDSSGRLVEGTAGLAAGSWQPQKLAVDQIRFSTATLPDGRPGRIAAYRFDVFSESEPYGESDEASGEMEPSREAEPRNRVNSDRRDGFPVTLVVGRDTLEINRSLANIAFLIAAVTAAAVAVAVFLSQVVSRHVLLALRETSDDIRSINAVTLGQHLHLDQAPLEIHPMLEAINSLQDRLRLAFEHERQFVANVAHELRTPLAGLKGILEVTLARSRSETEYHESMDQCREICDQTEAVIDNLFLLASVDAGHCRTDEKPVELSHLIRMTWKPFSLSLAKRSLAVEWHLDDSIEIVTDEIKLGLILRNLFENAVAYADPGSTIEISCGPFGPDAGTTPKVDRVWLTIANQATDLQSGQVGQLFHRFWRGDQSRSQTGTHSGLGLALCQSFALLLGGQIDARLDRHHRLAVELVLPACNPTYKSPASVGDRPA